MVLLAYAVEQRRDLAVALADVGILEVDAVYRLHDHPRNYSCNSQRHHRRYDNNQQDFPPHACDTRSHGIHRTGHAHYAAVPDDTGAVHRHLRHGVALAYCGAGSRLLRSDYLLTAEVVFHCRWVGFVVEKYRAVLTDIGYAVLKCAMDIMAELAEALNIVVGRGVLHRCREKHRLLLKLPLEKLLLLRVGYAEHHCNSRNYSDQRNDERSAENSFRHTRSLCYVDCLVAYSADSLDHAAAVS